MALARDADHSEQGLRLCTALIELGEHIPLVLERRALRSFLRDDPGQDALRARLSAVKGLIRNLS